MNNDSQNKIIRAINNEAHAYITMSEELNEALGGSRYIGVISTTLATATSFDVGLTTPEDCDVRLLGIGLGCDLNFGKAIVYEAATFTGSTVLTPINSNRQSVNTSDVVLHTAFSVAATITTETIVDIVETLGGSFVGGKSAGGSDNGDGFLLLKRNTKYIIRVSNEDGETANMLLKIPFIQTDLTD